MQAEVENSGGGAMMEVQLNTTAETFPAWMLDRTRSCEFLGIRTPVCSWHATGACVV
jgi:hypothetical protein